MHRTILVFLMIVLTSAEAASQSQTRRRKIPCKTAAIAKSCFWTRGRLSFGNGTPAYRLWAVGTHHFFGIYSEPSVGLHHDDKLDNEHPEFPSSVQEKFNPPKNRIFGDFEICPLERARPGAMQAACIETAHNIVVDSF